MKLKETIAEALAMLALACAVGLIANNTRALGIQITRNYFPPRPAPPGSPSPVAPGDVQEDEPLTEHEFQTATLQDTYAWFQLHDPSILFIDARDDNNYTSAHLPGAVQFFHYYPERYVDELAPLAAEAEIIVIYCSGGDCEDSIMAGRYLTADLDPPLDINNIYLFEKGMQAWCEAGYPIEPLDGVCD